MKEVKECSQVPGSEKLPEWFGIRAEFTLNTILYDHFGGETNPAYRDFLQEHREHFVRYAAEPEYYDQHPGTAIPGRILISTELCRSLSKQPKKETSAKPPAKDPKVFVPAQLLRALLQNENTYLRTELNFLGDLDWSGWLGLLEQAKKITEFDACIYPERDKDEEFWMTTLADYKVTQGLLEVAISVRLANERSADLRRMASAIQQSGIESLRAGYRRLKEERDKDRKLFQQMPWNDRVFMISNWETSCYLAQTALLALTGTDEQ